MVLPLDHHQIRCMDVLNILIMQRKGLKFDMIILDPLAAQQNIHSQWQLYKTD